MTAPSNRPVPPDLSQCHRVLIIKPSSLGDIVHTLPSLHDLKRTFPHLEITWLANTEWLPLLQGHPDLTGTLEFPRQRLRGIGRAWSAGRWMLEIPKCCQPEVTLDFQGLFRSGLISWCSRSRHRVGLDDAREGARLFHNFTVGTGADTHAVDRYRALVAALGADISEPPIFDLPQGEAIDADLPRNYLALHPFSRGKGKSLTPAQVNDLCRRTASPVVVLGRVDPVQGSQLQLPDNCLDLLNKTSISQLIACLRQARAVISVDSGPMHLAAAVQPARLLAIHTWSDPRKVGPYPGEAWVWKGGEIYRKDQVSPEVCRGAQAFRDSDIARVLRWIEDLNRPM